ncbi:MAG: GNAT family N-acetyltransferase [Bacteroidales bacterium]|nr:GNAT family N-acetyltransferase [Bacteroidales bacterium]
MVIKRYATGDATEWDAFVECSKNGTFLFKRAYMDYHADRFHDHSLLYYDNKKHLVAIMPGNEVGNKYYSHQGLTYGGLVLSTKTKMADVMNIFDITIEYLRSQGFSEWHYKQIPSIYHKYPSEEDEYALWRHGAQVSVCNISTTISLNSDFKVSYEERRKRGAKKATAQGYVVRETDDIASFWPIVEDNLMTKYGAHPIHSLNEIVLLKSLFSKNIRCFVAEKDGAIEGGIIAYQTDTTLHHQYPHATIKGKQDGVIDLLTTTIIEKYCATSKIRYYDFGTSNEDAGRYLNENLIAQKEGFGGRGIAYKTYTIRL